MQAPASFSEHVCLAAGTPMHHIEAGTGELVVLIHGSLCDYRYWRWQMQALSGNFRVAAPSLPGCWPDALDARTAGADGNGADTGTPFSMAQHVESVIALCDHLSPGRPVHIVGHSRGAQVALEAALALAGRVGKLVLADPGFPFTDEPPTAPVHVQIARRLGSAPIDEVLGEFVDTVNGPGTWRQTVSWFKDMVRANAWTLLPQLADIDRGIERDALAGALHCPVLLVGGELSPPRYGSRIESLLRVLPQARHVVVPKAAHGMNLANARYFNEAVLEFLRSA